MLNSHRGLGAFQNALGASRMYFKRNKSLNNHIIMSKITPTHLDVGTDGHTDVKRETIIPHHNHVAGV